MKTNKFKYLFISIVLLCFTAVVYSFSEKNEYTTKKQIRYGFTIQNKTNHVINNAEFWACAPVKQTSNQLCKELKVSHPYTLMVDNWGNQILHFKFDTFPPYETKIINIKADVFVASSPNKLKGIDTKQYLKPQRYIESENIEIKNKAKELLKNNVLKTVDNINVWVSENIKYSGYIQENRGALYALTQKQGDCTEFASLFTALCRSNDIPSRVIGGYICRESQILKPSEYHNWSEFYHKGIWKIADPQNKVFMKNQSDYVAMKIDTPDMDNNSDSFNRFKINNSELIVKMN